MHQDSTHSHNSDLTSSNVVFMMLLLLPFLKATVVADACDVAFLFILYNAVDVVAGVQGQLDIIAEYCSIFSHC